MKPQPLTRLVLVTALAVAGIATAAPAHADTGKGRIVGRLTDAGEPVPNYVMTAYEADGGVIVKGASTGPDGRYVIPDLPAGTYKVQVTDDTVDSGWRQWV